MLFGSSPKKLPDEGVVEENKTKQKLLSFHIFLVLHWTRHLHENVQTEADMAVEAAVATDAGKDEVDVVEHRLSIESITDAATSPKCGAIALFVGKCLVWDHWGGDPEKYSLIYFLLSPF